MAPLVKLAVVSKSGEEASFLQKWACLFSSSLHSSRKTAIFRVYYSSSYQLSVNGILLLTRIRFYWCLQNHVRQNGG